jgi:hypothetical protein
MPEHALRLNVASEWLRFRTSKRYPPKINQEGGGKER